MSIFLVTHAAISHQIKALERWLEASLIQRLTRAVQLTDAGRTYLPVVESAFNQIHSGTATRAATKLEAPLYVNTTQAFAVRWLATRLGRMWDVHPDLDLRLHEHSWRGDVDFMTAEVVILAQRLEQLAVPGEVWIQGAVFETVPKRLPFEYESLGERELKGFKEPVKAYRIRQAIRVTPSELEIQTQPDAGPPDLPGKPSVAVLPFKNMSSDSEQEYFSDGIAEDIITALSKVSSLRVVER